MRIGHRRTALAIAVGLIIAACSPASSGEAPTTQPQVVTTQTTPTTTSPDPTTTTTTTPIIGVDVSGDLPPELAAPIASFFSHVQDPRNDAPPADQALITHHAHLSGLLDDSYSGTASMAELETGGSVAVATLGEDIVLLADDGNGWQVVGANLGSTGTDPWFGESPRRILVLGSDARPGGDPAVHRMDSIHVLTSVPAEAAGTILGWPRDTWVDTPYGEMRVNALTAHGRGPDAIFTHFTDAWEIPVEGYILTAFSGFEKLIAASVGRLLIELPIAVPAQEWWPGFRSGEQTLTPTRTLDFARTRKRMSGGDFTRSKHHGVIMLAVLTALQQGSVEDVPMLLGELVRYADTNLLPSELVQLGAAAFSMDVGEIANEVLPGHLGRAGGGASVVFLEPEADAIIADVIEDGIRNG